MPTNIIREVRVQKDKVHTTACSLQGQVTQSSTLQSNLLYNDARTKSTSNVDCCPSFYLSFVQPFLVPPLIPCTPSMKAKSVQTRSHNESRFASRARTPRKTPRADYQRCISARDELATFEAIEAGRDTRDAPRIATRNRSELRTFYSCCAFSCGLMEGKVRSQEDASEATCTIGRCRNSSVRCFSGSRRVIRQHNKNTVLFCRLVDCLFTNTLLAEGQATTFG